jgi:hypothetical protein
MSGWLVLTYGNDGYEMFESVGESRLEVAKQGHPEQRVLGGAYGPITVEWFDEEPSPKGKPLAEAVADEEEKAQAEAEKAAEKAAADAEKATAKK